jgi:hypothetical protein
MTLRALKSDEEIAGVPLDQPVLIELPGGVELEGDGASLPPETKKTAAPEIDGDAKKLSEQLEALKAAQQAERERADRAEREAAEAKRAAADRAKEVEEARKRSLSLEGDIITGGLQAAQNDRDAAKAAFRSAYEAGDALRPWLRRRAGWGGPRPRSWRWSPARPRSPSARKPNLRRGRKPELPPLLRSRFGPIRNSCPLSGIGC